MIFFVPKNLWGQEYWDTQWDSLDGLSQIKFVVMSESTNDNLDILKRV